MVAYLDHVYKKIANVRMTSESQAMGAERTSSTCKDEVFHITVIASFLSLQLW